MMAKRILALYISILISISAIGGYAFASMANPVTVNNFNGMNGGFMDNTGQFTITNAGALTNPLFITPIALTPLGTTQAHPANMSTDFRATNGANPGDWVLDFVVANVTNVPTHAVFAVSVEIAFNGGQNGIPAFKIVLYLTGAGAFNCAIGGCNLITVTFDLGGQTLTTPFTYLVEIQKVA